MADEELIRALEESHRRGFLGPGPVLPHVVGAQAFADAIHRARPKRELTLVDLGSGGGVPALPLLWWNRELTGVLVDSRSKRTRFLQEAVDDLALSANVQVVTGRVEELLDELGTYDVVTARSFGPPSVTLELAASLLKYGGVALISEPPGGRLWAADGLRMAGLAQLSEPGASIAVFERTGTKPARRRWKHMTDRPLIAVMKRSAVEPDR